MTTFRIPSSPCLRPTLMAAIAIWAPFPSPLHLRAAAQEPVELEGLVVTASRWAEPEWAVATHATVISGAELERRGIEDLAEALRHVSGLAIVRSGSFGAIASVFLRGGESDYTRVLVDGVPVNDPGGSVDLSELTTDNIERIEIVRGAASALYGSDAMSGVVQIFTRRGNGSPSGTLSAALGTFGTRRWRGALAGGDGSTSYSFSLGRSETEGVLAFNNQHYRTTFSGRVQKQLDPATDAALSVRYTDRTFHHPTDGAGQLTDSNSYTHGDALLLGLQVGHRWSDAFETGATFTLNDSDHGSQDAPDGPDDNVGFFGSASLSGVRRSAVGVRSVYRPEAATTLAAGYEREHQSVRSLRRDLSEWGTSSSSSENERGNHAAYAQLSSRLAELAVNGGVRVESNERFGTVATWRAGAVWRLLSGTTRLRLAGGSGIKEPTFYETYAAGFVTGNPELGPETSVGFEAGLDRDLGDWAELRATAFSQRYRNLIQYTSRPPDDPTPNFENVARARSSGIEAEVEAEFRELSARASYTWLDTEVEDAGFDSLPGSTFVEGEPLMRRPERAAAVSASYTVGASFGIEATLRRTGERADRDFSTYPASPVLLPAHTVVDISAELELASPQTGRPGLSLSVRIENILREEYQEVLGFAAPGRAVYLAGKVIWGRRDR